MFEDVWTWITKSARSTGRLAKSVWRNKTARTAIIGVVFGGLKLSGMEGTQEWLPLAKGIGDATSAILDVTGTIGLGATALYGTSAANDKLAWIKKGGEVKKAEYIEQLLKELPFEVRIALLKRQKL